jgi:hypothetical protein
LKPQRVFAITSMPPFASASLLSAPLLFIAFAWYAVFPMTILTMIVRFSFYARGQTQ